MNRRPRPSSARSRRPRARGQGDDGAIIVLSALLMTSLLIVAALVIDVANARQNRRQVQNAADAAALAAGQDLPDLDTAITTVKTYTEENYDIPTSAWVGCRDDDHLSRIRDLIYSNNTCISFSGDKTQIRVKLPDQAVPTFLAGIIGREEIMVGGEAEAAAVVTQSDRIVPAAVTGAMGTGQLCIEQSGNNTPCANRERGQFGSLNSPRLHAYLPSSNVNQTTLAINYAMNLDHNIHRYTGWPQVCDGQVRTPCVTSNVGTTETANHLNTSVGNEVPPVTEGYVTGFTADTDDQGEVRFCGRLTRPDYSADNLLDPAPDNCTPNEPHISVLGRTINGRHIYYWLDDDARQMFYPEAYEATAKGYPDTDPFFAVTNTALFDAGDERLDCFLAGYRWHTDTATETLPDCSYLGVTYPEAPCDACGPLYLGVKDEFTFQSYANNDGNTPWSGDWVESRDTGGSSGGNISLQSGLMYLDTSSAGAQIQRSADLTGGIDATLSFDYNTKFAGDGDTKANVVVYASGGGQPEQAVAQFAPEIIFGTGGTSPTSGSGTVSVDISKLIGPDTTIRIEILSPGAQGMWIDNMAINWTAAPPEDASKLQVAPIFDPNMKVDPRWGVIPRVNDWGSAQAVPVDGFWSMYASTTYTTNTKVMAFDAWVFDPALMTNDPTNQTFSYGFSPEPFVRLTH